MFTLKTTGGRERQYSDLAGACYRLRQARAAGENGSVYDPEGYLVPASAFPGPVVVTPTSANPACQAIRRHAAANQQSDGPANATLTHHGFNADGGRFSRVVATLFVTNQHNHFYQADLWFAFFAAIGQFGTLELTSPFGHAYTHPNFDSPANPFNPNAR